MGSETRNDADSCLVGMVFCLGLSEGGLFTRDLRHESGRSPLISFFSEASRHLNSYIELCARCTLQFR
jgi:hypothetical protein